MKIEKAQAADISAIFNLLTDCGAAMREEGILQWNDNYPLKSQVKADIHTAAMHCLKDENEIIGIIVIDENQSPEYATINWKHIGKPILVIHRLAVSPKNQKAGIGRKLMDFALNYAIQNSYQSIRLDAYSKNDRTLKFYEKRGYQKVGEIYFPYREDPFYCFEKKL